jgi:spermidine synthase
MSTQTIQKTYFDPTWQDDIFDSRAIDIPLSLPNTTPRNDDVWIAERKVSSEMIFGKEHIYKEPCSRTSILKPSNMSQEYEVRDMQGNIISDTSMMFPAKAWMSDSGEERCMMFSAAKEAKGHVLVAGLGLAIYPQFALALNRPLKSITIIEQNEKIIDFVKEAWLNHISDIEIEITIIKDTIENYLSQTKQKFDTIYLDTWEDADPRFLAHINYLIDLASKHCSENATIQCWGYAKMIDTFIKDVKSLTINKFPLHEHHLDPVLQGYVDWLMKQKDNVTEKSIEQKARSCALEIKESIDNYNRDRCFTAFATSITDFYRNLALSKKIDR